MQKQWVRKNIKDKLNLKTELLFSTNLSNLNWLTSATVGAAKGAERGSDGGQTEEKDKDKEDRKDRVSVRRH